MCAESTYAYVVPQSRDPTNSPFLWPWFKFKFVSGCLKEESVDAVENEKPKKRDILLKVDMDSKPDF